MKDIGRTIRNIEVCLYVSGMTIVVLVAIIVALLFNEKTNYDVNRDGRVDALDLLVIQKYIIEHHEDEEISEISEE